MSTLLVINGENRGDWYSIGETALTVGRDESLLAELLDPYVSRHHLEIRFDPRDGRHYAVDLGSRNGILVNGVKVDRFKALEPGDMLQVGHTLLVYSDISIEHYREADRLIDRLAREYRSLIVKINESVEERKRHDKLHGTGRFHAATAIFSPKRKKIDKVPRPA